MRLQATIFLLVLGACARGEARDEPPVPGVGLTTVADSPAAPAVMPENAVVLPDSAGPMMVRQCSRGSPQNVRGFWSPGEAEVAAFDRKLIPMLQGALDSTRRDREPVKAEDYLRQYLGVVMEDGRRIVYVNGMYRTSAVDRSQFDGMSSVPESLYMTAKLDPRWRTAAWVVCDGGRGFFGAEYDPATREIANFEFNGPPDPR